MNNNNKSRNRDSSDIDVKTIILAGGKGTRLYPMLVDLPKPMLSIKDKPLIYHIMHNAQKFGFNKFLFKTGYLSNKIEEYFGDGSKFGCEIEYFVEEIPLGTAGGLNHLKNSNSIYIILYGDVLINFNLHKMLQFHLEKNSQATLVTHHSNHPEDSDVVVLDEEQKVVRTIHKPGNREHGNITNAALYIMNAECFSVIPETGAIDFGKEIIPKLIAEKFRVYGYMSDEYMKDVGTIQRYEEVNKDIDNGKVFNKVEAVFLDRDGTINKEVNLLHKIEDFELMEGVSESVKLLNNLNIPVIVITNQPVVARNLCDEKQVQKIHEHMKNEFQKKDAYIDAVYYCPHHPEKNHPDGNPAYRIDCECRKPKIGMLLEAKKKFGLNLEKCFLIGDTTGDIQTAKNAGCKSILVKTGYAGSDAKYNVIPDYIFNSMKEAVAFIEKYNKE